MTDDELIALLRDCSSDEAMWSRQAADRIEALVKENNDFKRRCINAEAAILPLVDEHEQDEARAEAAEAKVEKLVEALRLARVHVANNAQGWSVSRAPSRADLTIIDAALAEIEGDK